MANDYDKIIRENIEAVILPLAERLLDIQPECIEELPDDLQTTIERKPDLLKKVTDRQQRRFILQIEFQSTDEKDMVYRMLEYRGLIARRYKLPVKQFVLYIGQRPPKMKTDLIEEKLSFGFHLKNIQDYDYRNLLKSEIPEEILLAVLANFDTDSPEQVIRLLLKRLQQFAPNERALQKYLHQLRNFSNLRKLHSLVIEEIKEMAIPFHIDKNDILYKEGLAKGLAKGRKEKEAAEKATEEKAKRNFVVKLLHIGSLTIEQIAEAASVTVAYVKQLQSKMRKE